MQKSNPSKARFQESSFSFREFIEETDDLITQVDTAGNFLYVSSSSVRFFGMTPDECVGLPAFDFVHPEDKEDTIAAFSDWLADSRSSFTFTNRLVSKDGENHYMLWTINAIKNEDGVIKWFNSIARDITPQILAEQELRNIKLQLEDRIEKRTRDLKLATEVFKHSLEGMVITDHNNHIIETNNAFTTITGYTKEDARGSNPRILKSNRHDAGFYKSIWESIVNRGSWEGEIWNRRKNGEIYPQWTSINTITGENGKVVNYIAVFHDLSEAKSNQEHIQYLAYHDVLTGLPNRALLCDRLRKAIASSKRKGNCIVLFFIDLDKFKTVNDSLGHLVGDDVLQQAAKRLGKLVRDGDTVSRIGGDEFVIMLADMEEEHGIVVMANRIIETFSVPFHVGQHTFSITASIGITAYPEDGSNPEDLLKNADIAMYQAKKTGRNRYHLYTSRLSEAIIRRITIENDLREALNKCDITVYYQPKVRLSDGKIIGVEALARWIRPDGSMIPPSEFIPVAEETGLIVPLGEQILEMACLKVAEWNQRLDHDLKLSVNLSLRQFKQDNLVKTLTDIIFMTGISPENLEMEITESTVMDNIDLTKRVLDTLSGQGLSFSVDDFGTGYSSLVHIKHLPLSTLKIDKSFVDGLPDSEPDRKIATVIISLAKSFELSIVAEGTETMEQCVFLKNMGCNVVQGYFYSPPVPEEKLELLLAQTFQPLS